MHYIRPLLPLFLQLHLPSKLASAIFSHAGHGLNNLSWSPLQMGSSTFTRFQNFIESKSCVMATLQKPQKGRTKMHAAFKDLPTFLLAWFIYISIRTSYAPERGPALNLWTERVIFYVQSCGYSWSTVLNYVISYYQKHQDSPADAWFSVDPELVANHFAVAQQVPSSIVPTIPSPSRKTTIYLNWNRVVGCNFD